MLNILKRGFKTPQISLPLTPHKNMCSSYEFGTSHFDLEFTQRVYLLLKRVNSVHHVDRARLMCVLIPLQDHSSPYSPQLTSVNDITNACFCIMQYLKTMKVFTLFFIFLDLYSFSLNYSFSHDEYLIIVESM